MATTKTAPRRRRQKQSELQKAIATLLTDEVLAAAKVLQKHGVAGVNYDRLIELRRREDEPAAIHHEPSTPYDYGYSYAYCTECGEDWLYVDGERLLGEKLAVSVDKHNELHRRGINPKTGLYTCCRADGLSRTPSHAPECPNTVA